MGNQKLINTLQTTWTTIIMAYSTGHVNDGDRLESLPMALQTPRLPIIRNTKWKDVAYLLLYFWETPVIQITAYSDRS